MEAALRWLAAATPGSAELLRLMDAPVPCGHCVITAKRPDLAGWAGYRYCPSHSRWYWGAKLLIICTCDGTITGFSLANPRLHGEREQARATRTAPAYGLPLLCGPASLTHPATPARLSGRARIRARRPPGNSISVTFMSL